MLRAGVLADEMGLGKTVQAISLVALLAEAKDCPGPHLVLAPKAVLPNWVRILQTSQARRRRSQSLQQFRRFHDKTS